MTRNGIEYNLPISPYHVSIYRFKFYFSSKLYKNKFEDELARTTEKINKMLTSRYELEIDAHELGLIELYRKIEKRGFYFKFSEVTTNGVIIWREITCLNQVKFAGKVLTENS